nr:MAG TPA: hypothetical protein [Bacteriophage sp.]
MSYFCFCFSFISIYRGGLKGLWTATTLTL